jgi:ribosomal protein L11 methyltransferase
LEWLEIAVSSPPAGVELVSEILRELGAGGVVIEDPAIIHMYAARTHPEEWAVSPEAAKQDRPVVKAYLPVDDGLDKRLEELFSALDRLGLNPEPEVSTRAVREEDWACTWKKYYKPVHVGRRIVVRPSWEEYRAVEGELVIELDPGMAFGCGTHPTTSLCLKLLEKYIRGGERVYDVGTGSGILAVAAAALGAGRVVAVDLDPVACRAAAENVARNRVEGIVRVVQGNLLDNINDGVDLVVSNIIASVIISLAPDAAAALVPGGFLIASGIIRHRAEEVRDALEEVGLTPWEQLEEGEWTALVAKKIFRE